MLTHLITVTIFMRYELFSAPCYRWWDWGIEVKWLIQGHATVGNATIWTKQASTHSPCLNQHAILTSSDKKFCRCLLFVCFFYIKERGNGGKNEAVRERNQRNGKKPEDDEAQALLSEVVWLKCFLRMLLSTISYCSLHNRPVNWETSSLGKK